MKRGVLYCVWGSNYHYYKKLYKSANSVRKHINAPICVVVDHDDKILDENRFDQVIRHNFKVQPTNHWSIRKIFMYDLSPFELTLFLDVDTEISGDVEYGFEKAEQHGVCGAYGKSHQIHPDHLDGKYGLSFNAGVLFFKKNNEVKAIFEYAKSFVENGIDEQQSLGIAMEYFGFNPVVLPVTWNFREEWLKTHLPKMPPQFDGDHAVKIWHFRKNKDLLI